MIKIILIMFSFWILISLVWYYKPTSFLNIKYRTISENKIEDFTGPMLIIASHAYCHADSMIVCSESNKSKNKFNIIAKKTWGEPAKQFFRDFPLFTSYNKIDICDEKKNNTVTKAVNILKNNENVVFLLSKDKKSTGIYHILEQSKVPILFLRIYKKDKENIEDYKNFNVNKDLKTIVNKEYDIEYEKIDDYPIDKKPEEFIDWVKEKLYN